MSKAAPAPYQQRPLRGVIMITVAAALIIAMNAFAKKASDWHDPAEILFYRNIIGLGLLLAYIAYQKRLHDFYKTSRLKAHALRGFIGNLGAFMVFWAYSLMPMADVTALLFAAPLLVTAIAALFLKESVGLYRWAAVIIGFSGVILITSPSGTSISGYSFLVVLGAILTTALVAIYLRELGKTEEALTTVFYFLLFGLVLTAPYMALAGTTPAPEALWFLMGTAIVGTIQVFIKTQAYRYAEASLLSPFTYTSIVWATLFGWLFWGDLPALSVVCGAAIIIAANLFIIMRERQKAGQSYTKNPPY